MRVSNLAAFLLVLLVVFSPPSTLGQKARSAAVAADLEQEDDQTQTNLTASTKAASSTTTLAPEGPSAPDSSGQDRLSDLKIIDQLLRTYDRRATPTNKFGEPTEVGCELFIRSFGSISEKTMDYQVDLYLRQHWEDSRLNHDAIKEALDLNDPKLVQAIWKPEVYFPNAKEGEFQYVTVPNVLLRIKPNGQILYMLRLKMKFSCMMELFKYPLDVQICTMEIASFSKTTRELILTWNKQNPVDLSSDLKMPQFTVKNVVTDLCEETSMIGNYSCLVARFHLSRSVGFHMVQSYVPTILIVVISWVSFWMDVDSVPGRTTLGVTTLLTVSSKSAGLNAETPQVSYVKAIDVWMGACTAFIFAALIEFTFVNYLWRKGRFSYAFDNANGFDGYYGNADDEGEDGGERLRLRQRRPGPRLFDREDEMEDRRHVMDGQASCSTTNEDLKSVADNLDRSTNRKATTVSLALKFDESCRILFPLNFLCFNIFYWWYYLYYTP